MESCGCDGIDPDPETGIITYFHCKRCYEEKPPGVSMREWNMTETGLLPDGRIRVWCRRHHMLVANWPLRGPSSSCV